MSAQVSSMGAQHAATRGAVGRGGAAAGHGPHARHVPEAVAEEHEAQGPLPAPAHDLDAGGQQQAGGAGGQAGHQLAGGWGGGGVEGGGGCGWEDGLHRWWPSWAWAGLAGG